VSKTSPSEVSSSTSTPTTVSSTLTQRRAPTSTREAGTPRHGRPPHRPLTEPEQYPDAARAWVTGDRRKKPFTGGGRVGIPDTSVYRSEVDEPKPEVTTRSAEWTGVQSSFGRPADPGSLGGMPERLDADRWGDLEILEVTPVDLPVDSYAADDSWWCGRCGDDHPLAAGTVVTVRSHLGTSGQIACPRCAGIAELRASGVRPRRVVLIEDDPDYRDLLRRLLEDHGAAEVVGYVADGREALVELERLRPDTVVLDLSMPRLDGLALLPHLSGDLEVIVLSGRPRMRARCQELHRNITVLPKTGPSLARLVEIVASDR
jgi:CheY-like chemotaxis protein